MRTYFLFTVCLFGTVFPSFGFCGDVNVTYIASNRRKREKETIIIEEPLQRPVPEKSCATLSSPELVYFLCLAIFSFEL